MGSRAHGLQWLLHVGSAFGLMDSRAWAQQLCMGLAVHLDVESSWTRNRTCVPCIAREILNHWTIREALI